MFTKMVPLVALALVTAPALAQAQIRLSPNVYKGPDGSWDYASFDPATRRVYVGRGDGVTVVDIGAGTVMPVPLPAQRFHGVQGLGAGGGIATASRPARAIAFDTAGHVTKQIEVGVKPDAILREPKTGLIAVMDNSNGVISLLDPRSLSVSRTINVGGALESAAADGDGTLFVNVEDRNEIVAVDVPGGTVLRRVPLDGCDGPTGLGLDRAAHQLVTVCTNGTARVLDSVSPKEVARLPIGPRPDAIAIDQERHLAFIPTGGDGMLTTVALGLQPHIVSHIVTARGARSAALDPTSGRLYLPAADFAPATGPDAKPQVVAGTFRILVVETRAISPSP